MGRVEVHGADVSGGRLERLRVKIPNLPPRTLDRDTVVRWMRDGHSFIPVVGGAERPKLELVEAGEDAWFVRRDTAAEPEDALGELPSVSEAS